MFSLRDFRIYLRMLFHYKPKTYWNDLLKHSFNLRGVGHYRLSAEENLAMYEEKKRILGGALKRAQITFNGSSNVLEIGCGVGFWTEYLKRMGVTRYTGNDIAEVSVSTLKSRYPEFDFILGDVSEIVLPHSTFDAGFMIDVTQHITDDNRFVRGLTNIWESLKPGAWLFITMWDPRRNVYLANKIRLNRIEKPRGREWYERVIAGSGEIVTQDEFNDKYLLSIRKS